MITFRSAREADLSGAYAVFYQNEIDGLSDPPSLPARPPAYLRHVLETGTLYVAEKNQQIIAYAGSITRGHITFITDVFVLPNYQSAQIGKALVQHILPQGDGVHFTVSSGDPRALALYIRQGMRPQWPCFALRLTELLPVTFSAPADVEIVEAQLDDPGLVDWDEHVCGRSRPQEHAFWVQKQGALPLWFRRDKETIGYGYVRWDSENLWHPDACVLGPFGAREVSDAEACVLAAVSWANQRSQVLSIDVPGPHPSLATLLEARFRISFVDTFVSSALFPFFDARCYIPSGGDLF